MDPPPKKNADYTWNTFVDIISKAVLLHGLDKRLDVLVLSKNLYKNIKTFHEGSELILTQILK